MDACTGLQRRLAKRSSAVSEIRCHCNRRTQTRPRVGLQCRLAKPSSAKPRSAVSEIRCHCNREIYRRLGRDQESLPFEQSPQGLRVPYCFVGIKSPVSAGPNGCCAEPGQMDQAHRGSSVECRARGRCLRAGIVAAVARRSICARVLWLGRPGSTPSPAHHNARQLCESLHFLELVAQEQDSLELDRIRPASMFTVFCALHDDMNNVRQNGVRIE